MGTYSTGLTTPPSLAFGTNRQSYYDETVIDNFETINDTNTVVYTYRVDPESKIAFEVLAIATQNDFSVGLGGTIKAYFRRTSTGSVIQISTDDSSFKKEAGFNTCNAFFSIDDDEIFFNVKGKSSVNMIWDFVIRKLELK